MIGHATMSLAAHLRRSAGEPSSPPWQGVNDPATGVPEWLERAVTRNSRRTLVVHSVCAADLTGPRVAQMARTFSASSPFLPWATSNSTR